MRPKTGPWASITKPICPFYYALAETFAIDDHYHCDVVGPTVPNRFYLMAATSFGHLTTNEIVPPAGGYKPITGTIFDKLDAAGITWVVVRFSPAKKPS